MTFIQFQLAFSQGCRQVKKCGLDTHGERAERANNGDVGRSPQRAEWGPGAELKFRERSPAKIKTFQLFDAK